MEIFFTRHTVTLDHNVTQCVSLHQCVWDGGMKKSIIIDRVVVKDKPSFDCVLELNMRGRSLLVAGLYHKKIEPSRYEVQDGKKGKQTCNRACVVFRARFGNTDVRFHDLSRIENINSSKSCYITINYTRTQTQTHPHGT